MDGNEKPTPLWKKEISFRRKPAAPEQDAPPVEEPEQGAAKPASASIWKKEVSLRKKPKPDPATMVEPQDEPEFALALEAVLADAEPVPVSEPEVAHQAETKPEVEHSWLTRPLEEVSEPPLEEPQPAAAREVPAARVEAAPEELVPAIEALDPAVAGVDVDVDVELPALAAADLADFAELLDLPDLPAVALPELEAEAEPQPEDAPVAEAPAKVPFYKRELSLKRGSAERKPKAERPARERATKTERDGTGSVPFYKRELSLKRGPKQWDAAEPAQAAKSKSKPKAAKAPHEPMTKLRRPPRPRPSLPSVARGGGKKLVGLKIGGSQIAAACVTNGAVLELVQAAREPLEHGIVVGGELRDPDALAVALKDFFSRHKLPKRGVRLGIANNRIGVRTFEVTGIDDPKQLANAIRFRAQEVLPIPLEEAVLDYQVLSEFVNDEGQQVRRVLLVVAYRELVDRYVHACRKAGLQIVGIDLEAFALLRSVAEPRDPVPGSERAALVAVSVGHDRSTFAVSDGRTCEFTRVLEWGGWALNIAIARALDMAPSEVEGIKRALSLAGPAEAPEGVSDEQFVAARGAARKQLQTFARELVSSLQFYQNQPGSLGIGEIALTGGTAHLPGLGAELEGLIGVPVRVTDPLTRLKVSKRIREREQVGSLAVAIGLGIED